MFKHEILVGVLLSIFVLLLTGFYIARYYQVSKEIQNTGTVSLSNPKITQSVSAEKTTLTLAEVQKHNTVNDCWVIDNNNVYNATKYLNLHPGGADRIIPYCGSDMTAAYDTKGGKGSHSLTADQDLKQLFIGILGTEVSTQIIQNSGSVDPQTITRIQRRGEDDD